MVVLKAVELAAPMVARLVQTMADSKAVAMEIHLVVVLAVLRVVLMADNLGSSTVGWMVF